MVHELISGALISGLGGDTDTKDVLRVHDDASDADIVIQGRIEMRGTVGFVEWRFAAKKYEERAFWEFSAGLVLTSSCGWRR